MDLLDAGFGGCGGGGVGVGGCWLEVFGRNFLAKVTE